MSVFDMIRAQQGQERTAVWMVGEQLMDILRREPGLQEIAEQDLQREGMTLADCEKKIKSYADKHKTGNFACVGPAEAEDIIREFYGLHRSAEAPARGRGIVVDLADFL